LGKQFAISALDRLVGGVYRWGGWLAYTWPAQILFLAIVLAGLYAFVQALRVGDYGVLMDWLEIPMLRRRSLAFLRGGLWQKVRAGGPAVAAAVATEAETSSTAPGAATGHAPPGRISAAWGSLRAAVASLSREEKIFAVYGVLTALWTAYAIYMGASIWQQRLVGAVRDLWVQNGGLGKMVLAPGHGAAELGHCPVDRAGFRQHGSPSPGVGRAAGGLSL
jgi:putative peptide zinc metalloprotease protein